MSRNLNVALRIGYDGRPMLVGAQQSQRALDDLGDAGARAGTRVSAGMAKAEAEVGGLAAEVKRLRDNVVGVAVIGAGTAAVTAFGAGVLGATQRLQGYERALEAATGGTAQAASAMAFVRAESERLGLSLEPSLEGFVKLSAAARGTKVEGEAIRDIFIGVAEAGRVLNLSADNTLGAITALEQMLSKGKVSAEELRGQLGERLTGAMRVLAEAMGITTQELDKQLATGTIYAEDVLPKMAARLSEMYGAGAASAATEASAELARLGTALFNLQVAIGEAGVLDAVGSAAKALTTEINALISGGSLPTLISSFVTLGQLGTAAVLGRIAAATIDTAKAKFEAVKATMASIAAERASIAATIQAATAKAADASATLKAVEAARADEIAKVRQAQVEIAAAEATIKATTAIGAQSAALRANRIATEQLAAAKAQLTASSTVLAGLGTQQARLEGTLAAATRDRAAAEEKLAGAQTKTGAVMTALKGAAASVVGFFGGPWGFALFAAAGAVIALNAALEDNEEWSLRVADAQRAARDEWAALTQSIEAQRDAYRAANPEIIQRELEQNNVLLEQAQQRADAGGASAALYAERVRLLADRQRELTAELQQANPALAEQARTLTAGQDAINAVIEDAQDRVAQLRRQIAEARDGARGGLLADLQELQRQGIASPDTATREQRDAIRALLADLPKLEAELAGVRDGNRALGRATTEANKAAKEQDRTTADQARALEQLARIQAGAARELEGPVAAAWRDYRGAVDAANEAARDAREASQALQSGAVSEAEIVERLAETLGTLEAARDRELRQIRADASTRRTYASVVDAGVASIVEETQQLRLSNTERAVEEAMLAAADEARRQYIDGQRESIALTAEEVGAIRQRVEAEMGAQDQILASRAAADEYQRTWLQSIDAVSQAFGDWLVDGARSVTDFGRTMVNVFKRAIADVVAQIARSAIFRFLGMGGGGGGAGLAALFSGGAGGGGGIGGLLGSILGGGGGGGGIGGLLGSLGGGLGSLFGGIGSALGLGGAFAGVSGGISAGVGAFSGVTGGITAGLGGTMGSILGALGSVASVLGPIAAIAGIIQAVSGGKLFGTSFRPTGTGGMNFSLGAGGATGETFQEEVRQRSLFRGRQWRTVTAGLDAEQQAAINQMQQQAQATVAAALQGLTRELPALISGSARVVKDAAGNVVSETVTVLGRVYNEAADQLPTRLAAETIFAALAEITGQGLDVIAERYRANAAELLDAAQATALAQREIAAGGGLLPAGTLDQTISLIERLRNEGETLVDAYARAAGATRVLDEALAVMNQNLGISREAFVEYASALADAAGGTQELQGLFGDYLQTFYTQEERLRAAISQAEQSGTAAFSRIGLDINAFRGTDGLAEFRRQFEAALPTLTPEQTAEWLRAARALGLLSDLSRQLADVIGEDVADAIAGVIRDTAGIEAALGDAQWQDQLAGLTEYERALATTGRQFADLRLQLEAMGATAEELAIVEDLRARALARVTAAEQERLAVEEQRYADLVGALRDEIDGAGLSEFGRRLRDVDQWAADTARALEQQARAAGRAAAANEDLALVQEAAALRAAALVRQLEQQGRSLAEQLFGTPLSQLETRIRELEASSGSAAMSVGSFGTTTDDAGRAAAAAVARIREYLDDMMLGPLGGLRPRDALAEAQRQFTELFARAQGGDAEALQALPQLNDTILRLGQQVFASGAPYLALRDQQRALLEQLARLQFGGTGGGGGGGGGAVGGGGGGAPISGELQALYSQREALLAQQAAAERRALAMELVGIVADLVRQTERPLTTIASELGFTMDQLVGALGVNLEELNATTAARLAEIAGDLGVNLSELAASVGIDLGSLADAQSLLNDRLEAEIAALPQDQRDQLEPLLRGVEEAALLGDNALVEQRMQALVAATSGLAPQFRNQLAPLIEELQPVAYDQLIALGSIDFTAVQMLDVLRMIEDNTATTQPVPPPPSTPEAAVASFMSRLNVPAARSEGGDSNAELVRELRALRAERKAADEAAAQREREMRVQISELRNRVSELLESNRRATQQLAETVARK